MFHYHGSKYVDERRSIGFVVRVTVSVTRHVVWFTLSHVLVIFHGNMSNIAAVLGVQEQAFAKVNKCPRFVENNVLKQSALCWSSYGF